MTPKTKRNILRIIPFGLIWLLFSIVYSLLERGLLGPLNYYPSTGNPYNFNKTIIITPLMAAVVGLSIGTIEVLYINKLFIKKSLFKKIFFKLIIYLAIIIAFLLLLTVIYNSAELHTSVLNENAWNNTWSFFLTYSFWGVEIYMAAIIGVSLFYTEVSENIGQGVLTNFLSGKYHSPKEEDRIFMFLDMRASTTIAESIGHLQYFKMLKEYFSDLSNPIIQYSGEVYQYVGDEIIVSWSLKSGLKNNNCVNCFFAMKAAVKKQEQKYKNQFGVLPEFKAGLHAGSVTTGEIGVVKKEIIFTGDVLNTTARIQGCCNQHNVELLISGQLMKQLNFSSAAVIKSLGESELRGRDEKIELFTILSL